MRIKIILPLLVTLPIAIFFLFQKIPRDETTQPSRSETATSTDVENLLPCDLPSSVKTSVEKPLDIGSNWQHWRDSILEFEYPSGWKISRNTTGLIVVPPYDRPLPFRGDGDKTYGITIGTRNDDNWPLDLGTMRSEQVYSELPQIQFPVKKVWLNSKNIRALIAYCIYDYESGISALVPLTDGSVIHIAISRFAEGENRPDDWNAFFGILWSLRILPTTTKAVDQ